MATPPSGGEWVHEVKFDGYRVQMRATAEGVQLRTRKGLDWTRRFPEIAAEGARLAPCLVDGEICALNAEGASDFGLLQAALSDGKTGTLVFFLFDLLFDEGRDLREEPLSERKALLEQLLRRRAPTSRRLRFVPHFVSAGEAMLDAACRMHLEGVISKRIDAPYRSGRGDSWTKSKCRGGQEVVIGGWTGEAARLRSLLVGAYRGDALIYIGRVGTGFNARTMEDVLARLRPLQRTKPPFDPSVKVPRARDAHWVEPKLVAEIAFENITASGVLRQASFKGLRLDKAARSVVPEFLADMRDAGKGEMTKGASGRLATKDPQVAGVAITHADKEMWPPSGAAKAVTKYDLALFYEKLAPRMLPHIADRPLSIVRAPDGIEGQQFFQRHALAGAQHLDTIKVKGLDQPYLTVHDVKGLVALAQAAVLELHPWGARRDDPDVPERLIFDLDPAPDVDFARVMEAAKQMRQLLDALGLVPFLKTTGGKGLHVVVAINGGGRKPADWKSAKAFAKGVCVFLEKENPALYTTTVAKKARTGKIFLDYLRNDRTSTAVAPWSPRARPGATVAVPLEWAQLRSGLDPTRFTVSSIDTVLRRADPWQDLPSSARSLEAAQRKLEKLAGKNREKVPRP